MTETLPVTAAATPTPWSVRQRYGLIALVVAVWSVALANLWFAMADPVELEVREGTVWLHVLAQSAGQSLYNPGHVAFLNMNHGPLDPMLKALLHRAVPVLPAHSVTRAFVALLPLALAGLFAGAVERRLAALLWAGAMYVFLLGFGPAQFLIGRSDPTALVGLCALLALWHCWARGGSRYRQRAKSQKGEPTPDKDIWVRSGIIGAMVGLLALAVVLTNWRYAAVTVGVALAFGVEGAVDAPEGCRARTALAYLLGCVVSAGIGFALMFISVFNADWPLYYRHFFGVFTLESGWGMMGRMPYDLFPSELADGRALVHLALLFLTGFGLRGALVTSAGRVKIAAWFSVLGISWVALTYGFSMNHGAGGVHYFAPVYLVVGYLLTRMNFAKQSRYVVVALSLVVVAGLPWVTVANQARALAGVASDARDFRRRIQDITRGAYVYSEDVHLQRNEYAGEVVDVGDMVSRVAVRPFFGPEFQATVQAHYERLREDPPPFVLVGAMSVLSPQLQRLLAERYEQVIESKPLILAQGGLRVALYRRRIQDASRLRP
jgi:hypothetical protein